MLSSPVNVPPAFASLGDDQSITGVVFTIEMKASAGMIIQVSSWVDQWLPTVKVFANLLFPVAIRFS